MANGGEDACTAVLSLRVHFVKACGTTSVKSFELPTTALGPGASATLRKTISLRQQSTRTHHAGTHAVEILVNGKARPVGAFTLTSASR